MGLYIRSICSASNLLNVNVDVNVNVNVNLALISLSLSLSLPFSSACDPSFRSKLEMWPLDGNRWSEFVPW